MLACLVPILFFRFALATGTSEEFHEELVIRPLQDGKLLSRFSFTTLLKGATPRDPQTLGTEDQGMQDGSIDT